MQELELWVAVVIGVLQGVFEWLPISSEGNVSLFLTLFTSTTPEAALNLSLFLHAGTAVSATIYYRTELLELLRGFPDWTPGFSSRSDADISFLLGATLVSFVVAGAAYTLLTGLLTAATGGVFVAAIGILLVLTGLVQLGGRKVDVTKDGAPDILDLFLVGVLQGLAVLPGVSRSGTTVSALLLRGNDGETSLRLSFILSIPASLGAGLLTVLETNTLSLTSGAVALLVSAVVGYLTIDALMRFVERVAFWSVCVALGVLAVFGGLLVYAL